MTIYVDEAEANIIFSLEDLTKYTFNYNIYKYRILTTKVKLEEGGNAYRKIVEYWNGRLV